MIRLQKAIESDLKTIYEMQKTAFQSLLEKYRDYETNPAAEPFKRTAQRFSQPNVDYYLIFLDDEKIGAVRVRRQEKENVRVQILILPAYCRLRKNSPDQVRGVWVPCGFRIQ